MDYKNVQPLADFDWGAIDKKEEVNNEQVKQMTEQYEQTFKSFTEQDVIEGTIVSISDREAVVNIGFKSDGVIPAPHPQIMGSCQRSLRQAGNHHRLR